MNRTAFLLLALFLFAAPQARAYTVLGHKWSDSTIKWYLHPSGSADVSFSQLEAALKASFSSYQSLSCFPKSFSYGGTKTTNPKNGIYIQFKESNWDPTVGDAAAYAQTWTGWGGNADYSVIVFNGQDLTWTTTEANDFFSLKSDIEGVATHELGHCLGLGHSRHVDATMFFSGGSAALRSLETDDKNGICYIYGNFTQGQPCDACSSDNNCASGYCLQYPDGENYCGKNCTSDSSCPENFYCYDISSGTDQCAATNGYCSQDGGNIPVGYFCYGHETCESGMCMVVPDDAYCSKDCTTDSQCPGWMKCIAKLCLIGGSTPLGGSCGFHTDCASGMCLGISDDEAVCTLTCAVEADCPTGFGCMMGYCLKGGSAAYGAACDYDMECESVTCISMGTGKKICTKSCTTSNDCPGKNPCTYGYCVPPGATPYGAKCQYHTDCTTGFCAGMSNKFCSQFCDDAGDCPAQSVCGSGGYCVPQQDPSDLCYGDDDCSGSDFCDQPAQGQAGSCQATCNPFADKGCDDWYACKWHYVSWTDGVYGVCVDTNGGGEEGYVCHPTDDPCLPNLYCANVGGSGQRCYRDCNATTNFGCKTYEACLKLGINSDPHHGVCVCNDPSCMTQPPGEDAVETPTGDVVGEPDTGGTPEDPGKDPVDPGKDPVDDGNGSGSGGGCSATPSAMPGALGLFLALLATLFTRRRVGPGAMTGKVL
jgi:uncharacterized protein (TIGR03382 family)